MLGQVWWCVHLEYSENDAFKTGVSWVLLNSVASLKKDNERWRDVDNQLIDQVRIRGPQLYP